MGWSSKQCEKVSPLPFSMLTLSLNVGNAHGLKVQPSKDN
jgi:hypothetical protein